MYERIIVALDGSPLSEQILPYVTPIAERFSSEITLLQVVPLVLVVPPIAAPTGVYQVGAEEASQEERESAIRYLETVAARLRTSELAVQTLVGEGDPAAEILRVAREIDAGLLALSTHGRGGLSRLLFGSVAEEVVRHARRPVLLVRPEDHSTGQLTGDEG
ncbi:MAG: universal stress protein [Chloroflexi bacterium]|nr:universal stress protein [Chloroflexota bacterium]